MVVLLLSSLTTGRGSHFILNVALSTSHGTKKSSGPYNFFYMEHGYI